MELRIKTTTYGDGLEKFEIVKKHSIRIFGKIIAEWYTPFKEIYIYQVEVYSSYYALNTTIEDVRGKRHFEYRTREEAEATKRAFETGPIKYRGYRIIPIHNSNSESRDYYIPSNNDYLSHGRYLMRGYIGDMGQCMCEIDSTIASIEENRKKTTVVKSVIE